MSITLGMITKNSLTKMGSMLERVLDRTLEFNFDDLIVADDSTDGTRAFFQERESLLDCSTMIADFETKEA